MPALKNAQHERFAQNVAGGQGPTDAYLFAGYKASVKAAGVSASRLMAKAGVKTRIAELLARRQRIEEEATAKAITKLALSKEMILTELKKIAFSDIRKAVKWRGQLIEEKDNPDGGDTLVVKTIVTNTVQLISSDEIDADTAAAIKTVKQSATGGLSIELYDKRAALVDLGKEFGLWTGGSGAEQQDVAAADAPKHPGQDTVKEIASRFRRGLGVIDGGLKKTG